MNDHRVLPVADTRQVTLQVAELDCAEEVRILQEGLARQPGIEKLDFNVLQGCMDVHYDQDLWSVPRLVGEVRRLGMTAQPRLEVAESPVTAAPSGNRPRERALVRSGAFLVVAVAVQAWDAGSLVALFGGSEHVHAISVLAILLYLAAIGLGLRWIFPKAVRSVLRLSPDMNLLMTVAVLGAILLGEFFEAAMVTFLFTLSEVLEQRSVSRARRSIHALMSLAPDVARRRTASGEFQEVPTSEVQDGQVCNVRPGERVPLDGEVISGISSVDQAPITGESVSVEKQIGDSLYAGTINGSGSLEFRVDGNAGSTLLSRIVRLIEQAYQRRAPSEQWVDQFARYYTPTMMLLALAIMVIPPTVVGWSWDTAAIWFYNGLVLLVIACPCALVISTPVSIVSGLTAAARQGVLVKGGLSLELLARVEAVILDKTGTITRGTPAVTKVICQGELSELQAAQIAAALQRHSTHPIAAAVLQFAKRINASPKQGLHVQEIAGRGISGEVTGEIYWLGSQRLAGEKGVSPESLPPDSDVPANQIFLGTGSQLLATFELQDELRDTAAGLVKSLRQLGMDRIELVSGDRTAVVRQVAEEVGIDHWHAEQLPEDKIEAVARLQKEYQRVAMVGDGINDGPALAAADVGIAMGAMGSDTAIETADVALMSDEIEKIPWLIRHGRKTLRLIRQNIIAALAVKAIFVLLTLVGYSNLWLAILADTGVSLAVIANSLRLLRTK